jgi:hypothetical protein
MLTEPVAPPASVTLFGAPAVPAFTDRDTVKVSL